MEEKIWNSYEFEGSKARSIFKTCFREIRVRLDPNQQQIDENSITTQSGV